ncbi:MAG TPA: hypothetical protein VL326_32730 [Kofleriaceae bacterium]|jgi:hypothetical protein|nr:hypothetical protein [Kofleriaceae bacterium]
MRIVGLVLVVCVAAGCKNKGQDADTAPDPAALKAQQELIARRDKLLEARQKLQGDRDKLDAEIKDIQAKGGDASEQIKKREELDTQIETSTSDLIGMVNSKLDSLSKDKSAQVAAREADLASREKTVADREARIAERERLLAQRDAESAARWKESCNTGGAPVIITQQAPKGGNWTNKDVTALLQKARKEMNKKGLINSDLPGPAANYESDATKAMNDNNMSQAYIAAANLVGTIDSIAVNRGFIQQKMARIQGQIKGTKLDEATNKELQDILGDVMSSYNNGDFAAANRRLNTVATKLAKQ